MDRERQEAFEALYKSYIKILKINLTKDSYYILKMNPDEKDSRKGFSDKISMWMIDFALSGQVYFDDLDTYASTLNIDYLRDYFKQNKTPLCVQYRRYTDNQYKWVMTEIIPAQEYTDDNQVIFLYAKDVNDNYSSELEIQRELEHVCNTDSLTGLQNYYSYKTKCLRFSNFINNASVGAIFCDLNGLKIINDTKGHSEGNRFICDFAAVLKNIFLPEEIFRISGDEFVIILLAQNKQQAVKKFNNLEKAVFADNIPKASIGFAWASKAKKIQNVVEIAEDSMYKQKQDFYTVHPELKREIFEEKLNKETQAIITNLTSSYPTVGIIDLVTDELKIIKMDSIFPEALQTKTYTEYINLFKNQYFSEQTKSDLKNFDGITSVKKYLKNQISYEINFQITSGEWRQAVYSTIETKNGEPSKALFYAQKLGVDLSKKLENERRVHMEYELLEGLSYEYSLISVIDTESTKISVYRNHSLPEVLINTLNNLPFNDAKKWFMEHYVVEEDLAIFDANIKLEAIAEYLKKHRSYSFVFHSSTKLHNTEEPTLSHFMFYKPMEGSTNIVFVTKRIKTKQGEFEEV